MDGHGRGFSTLTEEITAHPLPVEGDLPQWLSGTLLRNGPAHFEVGNGRVNHWFDGLGMVRKFAIHGGDVSYSNRFLRSETYQTRMNGDLRLGTFGTAGSQGLLKKLKSFVFPEATDNANVTVAQFGTRFVALTEVPNVVEFEPGTLETVGHFTFDDDLTGHLSTAHVHHDAARAETVGLLTKFGRRNTYTIYRLPDGTATREVVATIEAPRPAYTHSFALTDRYAVLTEVPFTVNPLSFLKPGDDGFIDHFSWDAAEKTTFIIVDREREAMVATPETDAFFVFHHVNAFQRDDYLVIDLVAYPDPRVIQGLYLERLASGEYEGLVGELRRYTVPLTEGDTGRIESESLCETPMELPTISPHVRRQPYRYVYGQGSLVEGGTFSNYLVKADIEERTGTRWSESATFCGEPVFVPAPAPAREDDGVVLSVILDADREASSLLVLDGETFTEVARAELPHVLPFDFHGQFFDRVW
ncbi:carotenoid oxygenase family protein [Haladaptatus sp. GCM10025707]|uniref:carotenoid oxygenase family protein n=1 Tax=unclassified Haladaptatus TaxID=2622732 RepID=UPI0023E8137C|nr:MULTISPECIES: carotenoid oxygenase family protein [unclassified Haladaptatus]